MLEHFFIEDIGDHDVSSDFLFPPSIQGEITIIAKENGVFCGAQLIPLAFSILDDHSTTTLFVEDGAKVKAGAKLARITGSIRSLLSGERVVLNCLQRMSGIATATRELVEIVEGTGTKICETRKTAPGLRMLDKYAVRVGGGFNHRYALSDAVMLKDNHIAFAGSIHQAVQTVRQAISHTMKIEVEIESYEQLQQAIDAQVDIIMFDNCTPTQIAKWRTIVPDTIVTEGSGMITKSNVRQYAEAGIQYISLGSLTHSVQAFDMSAVVTIQEEEQS